MSAWLLILFVLFVSGANQVAKYFGVGGVAVHGLVTAAILLWGQRRLMRGQMPISERAGALVAGAVLLGFVTAFVLLHPMAQAGVIGGGSDGDDAINLAVRAALAGAYPYGIHTYLGNPATYLPGTLILATPFVLLGTAAYQNLAWLAVFGVVLWRRFGRMAIVGTTFAILALTPRLWQSLVAGSGMTTTSIAVALAVLTIVGAVSRGRVPILPALFLGLTVTTRANFLLVLPVVWMFVRRRLGLRAALWTAALSAGVVVVLVVPFALHDPATFWRATVVEQNWVGRSIQIIPFGPVIYPLICGGAALVLAAATGGDDYRMVMACAATQAVPVLLAMSLESLEAGTIHLDFTRYGVHMFFLALIAAWLWLERTSRPAADAV